MRYISVFFLLLCAQVIKAQSVNTVLELDSILHTNNYITEDSIYFVNYFLGGKEGGYPMDSIEVYIFGRGYLEIYNPLLLPDKEVIERDERLLVIQNFGKKFNTSDIELLKKYGLFTDEKDFEGKGRLHHNIYSTVVFLLPNGECKIIETKYGLPPERLNPILEIKGNIYIKLLD